MNDLDKYIYEATDIEVRTQDTIATEIKTIVVQTQKMMLDSAVEIGRRLTEAKELVGHGEWGDWLKEKVDFSKSTANNCMRIFEEYGDKQITLFGAVSNRQTFGNLSYSKALALLAVPEDEREEFVKDNEIEDMSTRELERKIKELQEEKDKLESYTIDLTKAEKEMNDKIKKQQEVQKDAENKIKELEAEVKEWEALAEEETKDVKTAETGEEEIKKRIDAATEEINEKVKELEREKYAAASMAKEAKEYLEQLEAAKEEMIAKVKEEAAEEALEKAQEESKEQIKALKKIAEEADAKVREAERKTGLAGDANVMKFKFLADQLQKDYFQATGVISGLEDKEQQDKLRAALKRILESLIEKLEE